MHDCGSIHIVIYSVTGSYHTGHYVREDDETIIFQYHSFLGFKWDVGS